MFQYKHIDKFPDDTQHKNGNSDGINSMHHFKVKVGWPVRIFFSEKVHIQI